MEVGMTRILAVLIAVLGIPLLLVRWKGSRS